MNSENKKIDLNGNTWVLQNPENPDDGWIMENSKEFPVAYQDGGTWETDSDGYSSYFDFFPEFSINQSCPFCDGNLDFEVVDKDREFALVAAYCSNHGDELLWFPTSEIYYDGNDYDEDGTYVPYGETYIKL